jgi:hypothetical protein
MAFAIRVRSVRSIPLTSEEPFENQVATVDFERMFEYFGSVAERSDILIREKRKDDLENRHCTERERGLHSGTTSSFRSWFSLGLSC